MNTPVRAPSRLLAPLLSVLVAVALVLSGCTGDGAGERPRKAAPARHGSPAVTSDAPDELRTRSDVGRVVGKLPGPRRRAVRRQVTRVVDQWWEAAFLDGDYPRAGFPAAFPGFTKGAERQARRDKELMSNAALGPRVDSVRATRRRVLVDLLAVRHTVRAATARFLLAFRTTGKRAGRVEVRGRLFFTRTPRGWRVFGYDVSKGVRA
ncbi:hypothetical protein DDE18_08510 [Nocardioides gansuensis]|uniref:Uncharacterized protein n=1 Tax=Nocardioides gansuensis TaxID=2138300 RepID=A0A2T8FC91_9ACTN|nr:hypothetical protein [Nocardioides gansuensis]PVG83327.1 hypothetical protein DDE18_08510 [Nocardioides gansuensis]